MRHRRLALTCLALLASAWPASAELKLWQQNFVGCSTSSSPYANQVLFRDGARVRPLMQIDGMNAWAVTMRDGSRRFALTTPDGLTIYGRVIGPEGEDISGALLATQPTVTPAPSKFDRSSARVDAPVELPVVPELKSGVGPSSGKERTSTESSTRTVNEDGAVAERSGSDPRTAKSQRGKPGTPTREMASIGSQTVADVPRAQTLDQLLSQARNFAMWFPLNKAKPGAPVVYMFVDPTCPHCAWSIDHLLPRIRSGSVAFRVILTPILSPGAFNVAASVMQQNDIARVLIDQARSILGEGKPAPKVDPANFDERVVAGLRRNVSWMRANGIPGVPFYLYRTVEGAQFAFGSLTNEQIAAALPDATPVANSGSEGSGDAK